MKRFAVVVAAMLVALMATGVFAQGDDARPRQQRMKNVFIFIGTVKDISGNKVTIDIDQVHQPGKGKVEFSQDQWTFKFGKGAKIFKNDSPAELSDFGTGDRIVIEAQKRSERNYEPIRMADEETARRMMERMRERQGGGPGGPDGQGGPGMGPGMGMAPGERGMGPGGQMGERPGMQFIQKFGIPVRGKILEINKKDRVLIIKPQLPERMVNRMRNRRNQGDNGQGWGPSPQDDQNGPPPGGQEFAPPPQGGPDDQGGQGPDGRPMMRRRMPEKIAVQITDDTKIFVNGKEGGSLSRFKKGQEVVVMLEPPPMMNGRGGPDGRGRGRRGGPDGRGQGPGGGPNDQGGPGMGPGMGQGMMPDLKHPVPAKALLDMKSAKIIREKMMQEWRNRRGQDGGPDNGWGPPPDDGQGPPPPPPDGNGGF